MKYWFAIFYSLFFCQVLSAQTNVTISDTICLNEVYTFPDTSFQISNFTTYDYLQQDTLNNNDTLFHYEINLWLPVTISIPIVSCELDSFEIADGIFLYHIKQDTVVDVLYANVNGCDSIESYIFTIFPKYRDTLIHQICYGKNAYSRDSTFFESITSDTTYESIFPSIFLCDSSYYEIFDVETPKSSNQNANVCYLENYIAINGDTIFEITFDTIYIARFPLSNACDSLVFIHIDVKEIDTSVTRNGPFLQAVPQAGVTYQWIDCVTNLPISGATSTILTIPYNGQFKAQMTRDGCVQSSDCYSVFNFHSNSVSEQQIRISNPVQDKLIIHHHKTLEYKIYAQDGSIIVNGVGNCIDMSVIAQGTYILYLPTENLRLLLIKK